MREKKWFVYKCRCCGNLIATMKDIIPFDPIEPTAVEFSRKLHRHCESSLQEDDRVFSDLVKICKDLDLTTVQDVYLFLEYIDIETGEYASRRVHVEDIDEFSKNYEILTDISFLDQFLRKHSTKGAIIHDPKVVKANVSFGKRQSFCRYKHDTISVSNPFLGTLAECHCPLLSEVTTCCEENCPVLKRNSRPPFNNKATRKKAFISQPMQGKSDLDIEATREIAKEYMEEKGYEVVDSFFDDSIDLGDRQGDQIGLFYLAKSLELLSTCDAIYMCKGWQEARGCCIEYEAAENYGLTIISSSRA